ncbi:MAG: hypothetical protein LUC88_03750 [Prevotella sp.]|nr:hypothetical protein [Prevotella sp.]
MKKFLLLSLALVAGMAANAQDAVSYDFYQTFDWCVVLNEEYQGNYDFVDKTGTTIQMEGTMLCEQDEESGEWHAVADYLDYGISLTTGELTPRSEIAADEAFIGWGENGPSRTTWMYDWGTTDFNNYVEGTNYDALTADDWVPAFNGLNFLRNANSASREDTYLQLPAYPGPCTLNVWVGSQGGSYAANLHAVAIPVVDGVVGDAISLIDTSDYTAKRYQKVSCSYSGEGNVAWRIGCDKMEFYIMYVTIEPGNDTGIANLTLSNNVNAPVYNLQGMRVDSNYKGIVIKNGKKLIQ